MIPHEFPHKKLVDCPVSTSERLVKVHGMSLAESTTPRRCGWRKDGFEILRDFQPASIWMEVENSSKGLIHSLCLGLNLKGSVSSILHEKILPLLEVTPPIFPKFLHQNFGKYPPNSGGLPQPQPQAVSFETWDMTNRRLVNNLGQLWWVPSISRGCAATVGWSKNDPPKNSRMKFKARKNSGFPWS